MPAIAVMNAKGGVGKTTLTVLLAESLAHLYGKKVLTIDSDGQSNLSMMLLPSILVEKAPSFNRSVVGWLWNQVLGNQQLHWSSCVVDGASDVDSVDTLSHICGDMDLTLLERKISDTRSDKYVRGALACFLREAKQEFDYIFIDCAPGISLLTEAWLRECDFHIIPVKADLLSISGINYLMNFKNRDIDLGFAELLGTIVTIKNSFIESENKIHCAIESEAEWKMFKASIPMVPQFQKSSVYDPDGRSYFNKYPGIAGIASKALVDEFISRLERKALEKRMATG